MSGLGSPIVGAHVTQPFGLSGLATEPTAYLQVNAGGAFRARFAAFLGGVQHPNVHLGVDDGCPVGTHILAPERCKVLNHSIDSFGALTMAAMIEGQPGTVMVFVHLSKFVAPVGSHVPRGGVLGLSGATGNVTGPHLHWEVRRNASLTADGHISSYTWMRYNPKRLQVGGDMASVPWIVPK